MVRKAFIFDFDDTIATTKAKVKVVDKFTGQLIYELTPSEYNGYHLVPGHAFDFSDFRCSNIVANADPTFLIHLAKEVYDENHSVYILTARSNAVIDAIYDFLLEYGIKAKTIHCVGSDDIKVNIEEEKRKILMTIIDSYDKVYYYDDHPDMIEIAKKLNCKAEIIKSL